jgi:4-hydroxy-3-methylbut-2-en-1-yl diphosphate synthase IspG/GcpE
MKIKLKNLIRLKNKKTDANKKSFIAICACGNDWVLDIKKFDSRNKRNKKVTCPACGKKAGDVAEFQGTVKEFYKGVMHNNPKFHRV